MSQYTAEVEGMHRRPNSRCFEAPLRPERPPSPNPWDKDLEVIAQPEAAKEEIPRVATLPPLPVMRADFSYFQYPVSEQYKAAKEIPQVPTLPSSLPVMDYSRFNYFQFQQPVAREYNAAKEIPRARMPLSHLDFGDGELNQVFPDGIEKQPCASNVKIFDQTADPSSMMRHVVRLGDSPFVRGLQNCAYPKYPDDSFIAKYTRPLTMDSGMRQCGRGRSEQLALEHQLMMDCLQHYHSMCPGAEYEPASGEGEVTKHCKPDKGTVWIHGNFLARRKSSGSFSFLPGSRTLFFFEIQYKNLSSQVITCTPLLDEPVTEAYSVLGFPLWSRSTRRSGKYDSICKTCKRRLEKGVLACGHEERERLCKMCFCRSDVLHPPAGEFAFGNEEC